MISFGTVGGWEWVGGWEFWSGGWRWAGVGGVEQGDRNRWAGFDKNSFRIRDYLYTLYLYLYISIYPLLSTYHHPLTTSPPLPHLFPLLPATSPPHLSPTLPPLQAASARRDSTLLLLSHIITVGTCVAGRCARFIAALWTQQATRAGAQA